MKHASDSTEQQNAEQYLIDMLSSELGVALSSSKVLLPTGNTVQIDGYNEKEMVLCEIYARIGKLKGSQPDKVASDFLKMVFVERSLSGQWSKHFCFASKEAAATVMGNSWLASVATTMGIKIHIYPLPSSIAKTVISAQERQQMVNK